jgi:Domain of unknown function (DUF4166)
MPAEPLHIETLLPAGDWAALSPDIRRRFAAAHAHAPVIYRGALTIRRSPIGALFALLAAPLGQPLPRRAGEDITTEVHVSPDARGGMVWERWLLAQGRPAARVRSTKRMGQGGLEECTDRGLGMALDVFTENGALVFQSRGYFFSIGRWRLRLPGWAGPGTCRVTHTSLSAELFRFTLEMRHPFFGMIFVQRGMFIDPEPLLAPRAKNQPALV